MGRDSFQIIPHFLRRAGNLPADLSRRHTRGRDLPGLRILTEILQTMRSSCMIQTLPENGVTDRT